MQKGQLPLLGDEDLTALPRGPMLNAGVKVSVQLCFFDGESCGTKFTIDYARDLGKPVKIVQI